MSLKLTGIFLLHSWLPTMDSHQHQQHLFHASKMEIKDKIVLLLITNIHLKLLELSSSLKQCTKLKQINILMLLIMFPVFTTMRYFHASTLLQYPPNPAGCSHILTSLSWPSGPNPWLWLLTTSPTELQIGRHTMPQILIHQHNALTGHTPSLLFNSLTTSLLSNPSFFFPLHSFSSFI